MRKRYFWLLTMRTFRQMMMSNALAMLLPLVFSLLLYAWVARIMAGQIDQVNQASLEQMKQTLDERIESLVVAANQISLNADVTTVAAYGGHIQPKHHLRMLQVQTFLSQVANADAFIREIYIWYPKSGYILSNVGRYPEGEIDRLADTRFGMDQEQLQALIMEGGYRDISLIQLPDSVQADTVLLKQRIYVNNHVQPEAHVFMLGERRVLRAMLVAQRWNEKSILTVASPEGRFLSEPTAEASLLQALPGTPYAAQERRRIADTSYAIGRALSRHGFSYAYLIPASAYTSDMSRILWVGLGYLLLSLVAGLILAYHLARKSYSPIQELTQQFIDRSGKTGCQDGDDLGFLSEALAGLLTEQTTLEQTVFTQKNFVRNDLLGMLVRGRAKRLEEVEALCRQSGIELLSERGVLVGIQMDQESRPFFEDGQDADGETELLIKFMLTSVIEEMFDRHFRAYYLEWKGFSLCLVSLPPEGDAGKTAQDEEQEIRTILDRIQKIFLERFGISLSLAVSSIRQRLEDLPLAMGEVDEIMETLSLYGESGTLMTSHELDLHEKEFRIGTFRSLQSLQRQVADLARKGEFGRIAHEVEQYITENLSDATKSSLQTAKLRMAGIVNLMLDTLSEMFEFSERDAWEYSNPLESLAGVRSIAELSEVIDRICREMVAMSEQQRNEGLHIPEILTYVDSRAFDPNLSVSSIADHFNLSLPYLSRLFKREYGTGLLDYIHLKRIAKAKSLLQETDLNVQDVSERVGYGSRITLTRAFKRFEGISPGEARSR